MMKHISTSPPLGPGTPPKGQPSSSSSSSSASLKGRPTLAQEIHDEFLVCKICLEGFKYPKCLECLHTFCEDCIDSHIQSESSYKKYSDYREFACPLCRKRTQLPLGGVKKLPDNFLVSSLSEMVGRRRVSKFPVCDICKTIDQKTRDGTAKCLDCSKMLCSSCVADHQAISVTSGHSVFDIEIEKDIGCAVHPDEMVRFYCVPCEQCVCVLCTFKDHRQHRVTQFSEAVTSYKADMEAMVARCLEKMDRFDSHIASLNRCENILVTVRDQIRKTAESFVREIESREQQLLTELNNIYGSECLEYLDRARDLGSHVENFRSTCKLAKTILGGKDMELLLIRKDVQEKLDSLNAVELKPLPPTVSKVVEFVSGDVDFGHLLDRDRPLLTTMAARKKSTETLQPVQTQTGSDRKEEKAPASKNVKDSSSSSSSSDTSSSSSDSSSSSASSDSSDDDDSDDSKSSGRRHCQNGAKNLGRVDRSTMTDMVKLVDRAVNTRARSMLSSKGVAKRTASTSSAELKGGVERQGAIREGQEEG